MFASYDTMGSDLIATVNCHSSFSHQCCPPPWTNIPPRQFRRATANQLSSSRSQFYTLYMFYTAKNLLSSFRVFSVFRGSILCVLCVLCGYSAVGIARRESQRRKEGPTGSDVIATVDYHSSSAIPSQTSHKPFDSIHSYAYSLSTLLLLLRTICCFAAQHFIFRSAPKPPAVRNTTNRDSISRLSIIVF